LGFSINSFTGLRVISIFSLIVITIVIVIVVLVHNKSESSASFFNYKFASASNTQSPLDIYAAYKYIIDRYNPSYGLVSENEHINKYWLWSDNLLAAQVLKGHNHDLSENISSTIKKYIQKYNIEIRSAWASLIDDPALITRIQTSFNADASKNIYDNVWYSDYDGNEELKCSDYANISFLKSIYLYKINKTIDSKKCYDEGIQMFDGKGFKDKSFVSDGFRYSTYKVALWKIASSITGFGESISSKRIIAKMQDDNTGGVYTFYSKNFNPDGQTNIETTSVVIMANTLSQ
jgi:hypothetical protein